VWLLGYSRFVPVVLAGTSQNTGTPANIQIVEEAREKIQPGVRKVLPLD
jgi:hypothetical protein